jgi:hypothetical protein
MLSIREPEVSNRSDAARTAICLPPSASSLSSIPGLDGQSSSFSAILHLVVTARHQPPLSTTITMFSVLVLWTTTPVGGFVSRSRD